MYSFLVACKTDAMPELEQARIKPAENYDWFVYTGNGVTLPYRGNEVALEKGQKFGVRKSANNKEIRLVLDQEINKVFTITMDIAKKLAKNIKRARK